MKKLALCFASITLSITSAALADSASSFMEDAVKGNLAEVKMGELAQQNGGSQGVKDFGRMLETDHKAGNEKAIPLAKTVGATVPTAPPADAQSEYDKLSKMTGKDFDTKFVDAMVTDHKKDIGKYKTAAKDKNPAVAQFAQATLPTLQKHLDTAESLQKQMK